MTSQQNLTASIQDIQRLERVCQKYIPFSEYEDVKIFERKSYLVIGWLKLVKADGHRWINYALKEINHEDIEGTIRAFEQEMREKRQEQEQKKEQFQPVNI